MSNHDYKDTCDLFNRALIAFIADLRPLLGHRPEYALADTTAKMLANMNPVRNQQLFGRHVVEPYGDRIVARDETFFMQTTSYEGLQDPGIVELIKGVWGGLHAQDRAAVWAHLGTLVALGRRARAVAVEG